jgi:hypothetical protein
MLQDPVICQTDPDLWFSSYKSVRENVAELCGDCWFKEECEILGRNESWGVWGGIDRTGEEPEIKYCRAGKHVKTSEGSCHECRKESQAAYYQRNKTSIDAKRKPRKPRPRKHFVGGYCVNGHLLEGKNVTIREKDQAVLCKKCISGQQRRDSIALATRPGVVR